MNVIIGFTDLLLNTDQNPQQIDRLQLIKSSAINLLASVNEILELSSIESGKFSLNYQSFDLRSCLENAVLLFSTSNNKVELILDIDSEIQQRITNDPIRLQQIITNLLSNANKFTEQGILLFDVVYLKTIFIAPKNQYLFPFQIPGEAYLKLICHAYFLPSYNLVHLL